MFKDQYPATYRAAVAYRRENERRERIKRSLLEAIGWTPPEAMAIATSDATPVQATEDEAKDCRVQSLRLTIADVAVVDIRIRRDGNALIADIDLEGGHARQADPERAS